MNASSASPPSPSAFMKFINISGLCNILVTHSLYKPLHSFSGVIKIPLIRCLPAVQKGVGMEFASKVLAVTFTNVVLSGCLAQEGRSQVDTQAPLSSLVAIGREKGGD